MHWIPVAALALVACKSDPSKPREPEPAKKSHSALQVFEPDGFRSWRYAQYFSAALAIDSVTETEVRARVQLSLPDEGKSMLVGAFTAKRCPPQAD